MPEGPELFLTSQYINRVCRALVFSGKVEKSEVSKNPTVPFQSDAYRISAESRGKELKLTLAPLKREAASPSEAARRQKKSQQEPMDLVFRFGMSGSFRLVPAAEMPKHAHLRFYTKGPPPQALCYVDFRRFGRWEVDGAWQPGRGPCVMTEYERFRENVLRNLPNKAFDKPICEALLNQTFFNGIGNYLRAEILYRLKIPPFEKARTVLEQLQSPEQTSGLTLSKKVKLKQENPDLLELCHMVPMEVIKLGGKGYDPDSSEDSAAFEKWLQCYYVDGMKSLRDANGRTIWFQGDPGPMAPKGENKLKKPEPIGPRNSQKRKKKKPGSSAWSHGVCLLKSWIFKARQKILYLVGGKSRKKRARVKVEPDTPSPKVKKLVARRNSRTSIPPKGVEETRKPRRRKGSNAIKETEDGIKTPKMRAKRKISTPREAAVKPDSPAENQKRPTSARKKGVRAVAVPRSRRAKPQ